MFVFEGGEEDGNCRYGNADPLIDCQNMDLEIFEKHYPRESIYGPYRSYVLLKIHNNYMDHTNSSSSSSSRDSPSAVGAPIVLGPLLLPAEASSSSSSSGAVARSKASSFVDLGPILRQAVQQHEAAGVTAREEVKEEVKEEGPPPPTKGKGKGGKGKGKEKGKSKTHRAGRPDRHRRANNRFQKKAIKLELEALPEGQARFIYVCDKMGEAVAESILEDCEKLKVKKLQRGKEWDGEQEFVFAAAERMARVGYE